MNLELGITTKMAKKLGIADADYSNLNRLDVLKITQYFPETWAQSLHIASNFKISLASATLIVKVVTYDIKKSGVEAAFERFIDTCKKIDKQDLLNNRVKKISGDMNVTYSVILDYMTSGTMTKSFLSDTTGIPVNQLNNAINATLVVIRNSYYWDYIIEGKEYDDTDKLIINKYNFKALTIKRLAEYGIIYVSQLSELIKSTNSVTELQFRVNNLVKNRKYASEITQDIVDCAAGGIIYPNNTTAKVIKQINEARKYMGEAQKYQKLANEASEKAKECMHRAEVLANSLI